MHNFVYKMRILSKTGKMKLIENKHIFHLEILKFVPNTPTYPSEFRKRGAEKRPFMLPGSLK